ncbi:MAG: hypothetical protein LBK91_05805 [Synergistaceae bacterium]|jgi:hypothetical protein|nr:hypothetical protein [Synergistaceae bacterium]
MAFEERTYQNDGSYMRKLISNMAEMQNWKILPGGGPGEVRYRQTIYGLDHEYLVTVAESAGVSTVRVETDGGGEEVRRQFGMLEKFIALGGGGQG